MCEKKIIQIALLNHNRRWIPVRFCHVISRGNLQLSSNELGVCLSAETLGALNGCTESTVDDQLGQDTEGTGDTEQDGVVVGLGQAVVLEKNTRVLKMGQSTMIARHT